MNCQASLRATPPAEAAPTMADAATPMVELAIFVVVALSSLYFCYKRALRYLQFFQQEDYTSSRFIDWYKTNKAFDKKGSFLALIMGASCFAPISVPLVAPWICLGFSLVGGFLLCASASREENPLTTGKIKLKLTARAKRILYT